MENSPSRQQQSETHSRHSSSRPSDMAMLTATPAPPAGFHHDYSWDASRYPSHASQASHASSSVSLPSIRHQFPDLLAQEASAPRTADHSPNSAVTGHQTSPGYVHSPVSNKRRRASIEDEQESERSRQIPRLYHSPETAARPPPSPTVRPLPATDGWASSSRPTPFTSTRGRVPAPMEVHERAEHRPSLPSLPPTMGMESRSVSRPPTGDPHLEDYRDSRPTMQPQGPPVVDTAPRYQAAPYEYSYRHASQVAATSPTHNHERTPFTPGSSYSRPYGDYSRYGDLGHIGMGADSKQRKRRGNLPKETTDKLRAWFMQHLSHPYPTEDEKQDLMRQTGLQMNQISNWFINARRRQLPTMINNAQVESDAIRGRGADGKILPSTERGDLHHRREGLTLSDGEGGAYDEELESLKRHRAPTMSRGSV